MFNGDLDLNLVCFVKVRCANQNVQLCKKMHAGSRLDRPDLNYELSVQD